MIQTKASVCCNTWGPGACGKFVFGKVVLLMGKSYLQCYYFMIMEQENSLWSGSVVVT